MGKVEDIYRAIRNNSIAAMEYVRPSDDELADGVARIRQRISSGKRSQPRRKARLLAFKIGVPAAAIAAAAVFAVVLYLPRAQTENNPWRYAGAPLRLDTVQPIRQHESVAVENQFMLQALSGVEVSVMHGSDGIEHISVFGGTVMISRSDATFAAVVHTKNREYRLTGTRFFLNTSGDADLVYMFEGSLQVHGGKSDAKLSANGAAALRTQGSADVIGSIKLSELLKFRTDLQKLLRGTLLNEKAASPALNKQQARQSATRFRPGDCVVYYLNNEKRHGKIHARDASGYTIAGSSGLEPGRWREGDIFAVDCE